MTTPPFPPRPAGAFAETAHRVVQQLDDFMTRAHQGAGRVISYRPIDEIDRTLDWRRWIDRGGMTSDDLDGFLGRYLDLCTNLHHPHFLAHQVAIPHERAPLAELVNATVNNGMAIYEMGPAHVALERGMVEWMANQVGWEAGGGVLTHGGSLANLTALLAARARVRPDAWQRGVGNDLVVLAPASAHYCIARAAAILGLGSDAVVPLPVDRLGVLDPAGLEPTAAAVEAEGRTVMAVVANACQTGTGLYDPLDAVADFCAARRYWFHVDGAHGASALVSPTLRHHLRGVERADSVVWDAHKMLATSVLCAGALFRDPEDVRRAFQQRAEYFRETVDDDYENRYDRAIECTKTGLGLKLFVVLSALGTTGLARHVEHLYATTGACWERIEAREGFVAPYRPTSNILCFHRPGSDVEAVRTQLMRDGDHYLSSTVVDGVRHFRIVVMNPLTTPDVVDRLMDRIEECARQA